MGKGKVGRKKEIRRTEENLMIVQDVLRKQILSVGAGI